MKKYKTSEEKVIMLKSKTTKLIMPTEKSSKLNFNYLKVR